MTPSPQQSTPKPAAMSPKTLDTLKQIANPARTFVFSSPEECVPKGTFYPSLCRP